jgi:HSP20 family protein
MPRYLPARRGPAPARRSNPMWSPLAEMEDLYDRMAQLMQGAWGDEWRAFDQAWAPMADVRGTADSFVVEMDLPGVKKDDINVEVAGNELVVTGDLKDGADSQSKRRIRHSGHIEQRVVLPAQAEPGKATASLSDGVLTVTVPKQEADKPRRVPVSSG